MGDRRSDFVFVCLAQHIHPPLWFFLGRGFDWEMVVTLKLGTQQNGTKVISFQQDFSTQESLLGWLYGQGVRQAVRPGVSGVVAAGGAARRAALAYDANLKARGGGGCLLAPRRLPTSVTARHNTAR